MTTRKPEEEDRKVWGRILPMMVFVHEGLADTARMYLAYATTADRDGYSRIGMSRLMKLCGWWTGDEKADEKKASHLRVARTALVKRGLLKVEAKGRSCKVLVLPIPVSEEVLAEWNEMGDRLGIQYTGTWPRGRSSEPETKERRADPAPEKKKTEPEAVPFSFSW